MTASTWGLWPPDWLITAQRITGPSMDRYGNITTPAATTDVPGCLLASGGLTDQEGHTDADTGAATLYAPLDGHEWDSTDQVITPPGSILPGKWAIDGRPVRWPYGWQIKLKLT